MRKNDILQKRGSLCNEAKTNKYIYNLFTFIDYGWL